MSALANPRHPRLAWLLTAFLGHAATAAAQPPALTLDAALQYALDHYPAIAAANETVTASASQVDVARAAYLPRLDLTWQTNRATANNMFGQLLPQSVIPAMSGPVLESAATDSVWGSAGGALLSWDAYDFGLRSAAVREAQADVMRARSQAAVTRLDMQAAVGDAFLAVLAADQSTQAAAADLQRREVLASAVHTLADNQLRPGADASRADAERAAAQTRLIRARQAATIARTLLARLLALPATTISVDPGRLLQSPPALEAATASAPTDHPVVRAGQAAVDLSRAREAVLQRTDRPRLLLQSALFARASGAHPDGRLAGGPSGLGLDRANWATGVQVVVPNLFDYASLRARRTAAAAQTRAEQAHHEEAMLSVTAEQRTADATLDAAVAIAQNTLVQVAAARQSEGQARARYDAGLAALTEVAEAQSLLATADYQDAVARVDVWRALLAQAVSRGDITPFIARVRTAGAP